MITLDPGPINAITNHPEVLPGHLLEGQDGPLDVTPSFERGGFGVHGEGYGFLLDPVSAGVYEVHTSFLPEYRKRSARLTHQSMGEVFVQTDCLEIVTRIKENAPALRLATAVGMQRTFVRDGYQFLHIGLQNWAARAKEFRQEGADFHTVLESSGVDTDHDEDTNHDQYVGIAVAMAQAGQVEKAIWFYNTWAALAGFHPAVRTGEQTAFIGNAEIRITPEGVEVTKCQQAQ